MFYGLVLFASALHLIDLYDRYRRQKNTISENDRVLMSISAAIALSLPVLGLVGKFRIATLLLLAVVATGWYFRKRYLDRLEPYLGDFRSRYHRWSPLPCLVLSIAGLFCWAWYL